MNQYDVMGGTELLGYGAPQVFSNQAMARYHAPSTGGGLDSVKEWLDKRSVGNVPNKYLVAGGAVAGILVYGYMNRWF